MPYEQAREACHRLLVDLDEDIRDYIIDMLGGDETEEEMIQDWMSKRDGWREDFKRKHRDALRRQKRNRQGGDKFYE